MLSSWRIILPLLAAGLLLVAPAIVRNVPKAGVAATTKCTTGHIGFRALVAHETHYICPEGSWYDGGRRQFIAYFSRPPHTRWVTLVLIHRQGTEGQGNQGVLWQRKIWVRRPESSTLRGGVDFTDVYDTSPPAGAPPFGRYILTIYAGTVDRGHFLARGYFDVIED